MTTNLEWLRTLSVKELSNIFFGSNKCTRCAYQNRNDCPRNENGNYDCKGGFEEWLNAGHVSKIKTCPVCKGKMAIRWQHDGCYLVCKDCNLHFGIDTYWAEQGIIEGDYKKEHSLVEDWNRKVDNADEQEEIEPCPCGGKPFVNQDSAHYWVSCSCRAHGPYGTTREQAIKAWNKRLKEGKDNDY